MIIDIIIIIIIIIVVFHRRRVVRSHPFTLPHHIYCNRQGKKIYINLVLYIGIVSIRVAEKRQ